MKVYEEHNIESAAVAFSKQAVVFDEYNDRNIIADYCRNEVHAVANKYLPANADILELNCGTGIDAVYFASKGHCVFATDAAEGMIVQTKEKIISSGLQDKIKAEAISFENLGVIKDKKFDLIYSNFGGLNCTDDLSKVLDEFPRLLKPGGKVLLVIMPPFCLWESLLALKGNFKIAFRRWKKDGATAHIEGHHFKTNYYCPSYIKKHSKGKMKVVYLQGLSTIVPPEYLSHRMQKYPSLFNWLKKAERKWSTSFLWRSIGDYFIVVLEN